MRIMKTRNRSRHLFTLAALLPVTLSATIALPASAAPVPKEDRWVAMAFSQSTQKWYGGWSSDGRRAADGALDRCNAFQSNNTYDCILAGVNVNGWLAVALSDPYGPWGSGKADTATDASKKALNLCQIQKGGEHCRVVFDHHSSEH